MIYIKKSVSTLGGKASLRWCPHRRHFANNLRCWAHLHQANATPHLLPISWRHYGILIHLN